MRSVFPRAGLPFSISVIINNLIFSLLILLLKVYMHRHMINTNYLME